MILWRVLTLVFGLLITVPTVILHANGYNIAFWVDEEADTLADPEAILEEAILEVAITPPAERPEVQEMFGPDTLSQARYIKITEVLPPEEILQTDEAVPDDALFALYAEARAPSRLIDYCAEVVATIATTCDVVHTETHETQTGKLELTGQLAFAPSFDMGDPFKLDDGTMVQANVTLPHEGNLLPANEAETRTAAMAYAAELCLKLQTDYGNCMVSMVAFEVNELWLTDLEVLPEGTNPQRLAVEAGFTVFADPAQLDEAKLAERLEELTNPA